MTGGGPFRDTTPAMLVHARAQLARLCDQHAEAQARYEEWRAALEALSKASSSGDRSWQAFRTGFLIGAATGLTGWLLAAGTKSDPGA